MGVLGPPIEVMPVEVYEGMNGDLVLMQEWSKPEAEHYVRIIMRMEDAEAIAERILAVAKKARNK